MRNLFSGRKRYALAFLVVGASLAVMGAQCQPQGGKPAPTGLSIDPTSYDFDVDPSDETATFTVTNNGPDTTGMLDTDTTGTNAGDFKIGPDATPALVDDCQGAILDPGETCDVEVDFDPTSGAGPKTADLVVDDPDDGEAVASLSGTAA
jgi:hypothetical protein